MAIDAADIGANFSNYVGNAGAAGGAFGVVEINTRPLEHLAAYTFYYNKSVWEQQKRETDAKVKELADLSDIALNNLRGKDKEQLTIGFSKLIKDASEYARKKPQNEQERIQDALEWQTKRGAFYNDYNSGKARAVAYETQKSAINNAVTTAKTKETQLKQLDESFDRTDIATPISAVPNFQIKTFDVPKPIASEFSSITVGANDIFKVKGSYYDPSKNGSSADATLFNLNKIPIKGTPEYNNLSDIEKKQADIQSTIENPASGWVDAVPALNQALTKPEYKNADGSFNAAKFEDENASYSVLMNPYNALKKLNDYSREKFKQAESNMFSDNGVNVKLPDNVVPQNFKAGFIDFAKGVNATQLLNSGSFAQYEGDKFTKDVTHTGEANDLLKARLAQEAANYRARLNEEGANTRAKYPYLYAKKGTDKQQVDDILSANSVLSEVSSIINTGIKSIDSKEVGFFNNPDKPFDVSDPTLLKEFTTIAKDGKTTIPPNNVQYDVKTDEFIIGYPEYVDDNEDKVRPKEQRINVQTYLSMKIKDKFPNKDIGEINNIISKIYNKEGNMFKIAKKYNQVLPTPTTEAPLSDAQKYLNSLIK